jgi:hypothetical protein
MTGADGKFARVLRLSIVLTRRTATLLRWSSGVIVKCHGADGTTSSIKDAVNDELEAPLSSQPKLGVVMAVWLDLNELDLVELSTDRLFSLPLSELLEACSVACGLRAFCGCCSFKCRFMS